MSKQKENEKTNVMRLLDQAGISYVEHTYDPTIALSAIDVASTLNQSPKQVFKTLVTVGKSGEHYVFVIPGPSKLNLKKAAKANNEKNIEMILQKDLLNLTGYIHGGCSPIGMKKKFKTFIDENAILYDTICVSAGKVGYQVELNPEKLATYCEAEFVSLID